jgi:hypothetical protein
MFSPSTPVKLVRRHYLDRIVHAVSDVERRGGGTLRRKPGIHQNQRASLRGLGLDERRGALQQRLDLIAVAPQKRHGLAALHDLAVLIVRDGAVDHPVGGHVVREYVAVQGIERRLEVARHVRGIRGFVFDLHLGPRTKL